MYLAPVPQLGESVRAVLATADLEQHFDRLKALGVVKMSHVQQEENDVDALHFTTLVIVANASRLDS